MKLEEYIDSCLITIRTNDNHVAMRTIQAIAEKAYQAGYVDGLNRGTEEGLVNSTEAREKAWQKFNDTRELD